MDNRDKPRGDRPTLTTADLDRLDALLREATPGPWEYDALTSRLHVETRPGKRWEVVGYTLSGLAARREVWGQLIAAAVNALPALLAEVRAAHARQQQPGEEGTDQ